MAGGGGVGSKGTTAAATATATIPSGARKLVQSLKEIVSCGDLEIYAMLKECNMDPDEAVNRLLSQDSFHEVKSKREKKKETKEVPESRPRAINSTSSRGTRADIDRGGRYNSSLFASNDYGVGHAKPSKKDNETHTVPTSSIMGSSTAGNNIHRRSTGLSETAFVENSIQAAVVGDGISSPSQPSSRFQHNWVAPQAHLSMADIVKMGKPQGKKFSTSIPNDKNYGSHNGVMPSTLHYDINVPATTVPPSESVQEFHYSQGPGSQVTETSHELSTSVAQNISHNDWPLDDESPIGSGLTVTEASDTSAVYVDPPTAYSSHVDEVQFQITPQVEEIHVLDENMNNEILSEDSIGSTVVTDEQIENDNLEDDNFQDEGLSEAMNSYQPQRHAFEHEEVEEVNAEISSAATNLQKLRLIKEELPLNSAGDNPSVIIPSHLQVTNAECSFLSFGSFGSGISATFSGSFPSKPPNNNLESTSISADDAPLDCSDANRARNIEYYDNDQLEATSNEHEASRSATNTRNYDAHSVSQPEAVINDTSDVTHGLQYDLPSGYAFSTTAQQNTAAYPYPQVNSQIQNFAPFSSLMPYTNSLPSTLLAQNIQTLREFDMLSSQSLPTSYSTTMSSVSGPTNAMPEMKPGVFSSPQSTQQTLPGTSMPTGPRLPQHLSMHPYSQPTLPLGPFANMISYPYLPQSYTYLPTTAFQQAYASNGLFHQSPATMHSAGIKYTLPQYKTGVSVTSSPHSATIASGYGGFGSSANIPANFSMNPSTTSANTTLGFDEALSMQYKEGNNHYSPNQQSAMWVHGAGSRTMSGLPSNTFYNLEGQSQHSGYRQGQPASNYGTMGYPNLYHSVSGVTHEHHENPVEGNVSGAQGLPSQQSHQNWQHY